ncbi:MAG: UDP-2,3-diacylglucosamine diphosphatase [Hydrogenophilales bacterium 28-61-23]|nr:MAG: UDP-2,3-diacylglucosamine diphosphatase [Hydrogenophilales bacterium 28-61-23]
MSGQPYVLFISDLHLTPERPLPVQLFQRFIKEVAPGAQALYILGDFFEAWVGDDNLAQTFNQDITSALKSLSERGVALFFLPGNRDFLVGPTFAEAAGLTLLADPTNIELFGVSTLLAHGDQFCTDDAAYQDFRRQVREPTWQRNFLAQALDQRLALAKALRERSEHAKADKKPEIMDVNNTAIAAALDLLTRNGQPIERIIHGHTHRPARHEYRHNGQIGERWVLPDWYETGGYLACDELGCQLAEFP